MTVFKGVDDSDQKQTVQDEEGQEQNDDSQSKGKENEGEYESSGGTAKPPSEPSWFDEVSKFYVGKKTNLTPDDELGKEMWASIKHANKLKEEAENYKKQVEEYSPYKTDLEWIMNNPKLKPLILAAIEGKPLPGEDSSEDEFLTPEEKRIKDLEEKLSNFEQVSSSSVELQIRTGFENHLKELQGKYPDMDAETVKTLAYATKAIYSPKARDIIEKMAKESHEKIERLKKTLTDKTYQDLREKGKKTLPTSKSGGSKEKTTDMRSAFDKAWENF